MQVDSDYRILDHTDKDNFASLEKFFLGWKMGAIDAVIMPQSFYTYCKEQNGTFLGLTKLRSPEKTVRREGKEREGIADIQDYGEMFFLDTDGTCTGVYAADTCHIQPL